MDVWHSLTFPVGPEPDGWRRYRVLAESAVEAEQVACQMTASHGGWTPVRSVVIDWPDSGRINKVSWVSKMRWRWWAWRNS